MKLHKRFALALTIGLFVAGAFSLADAPTGSWVGKKVMPARPGQDITVNPHADDQGAAFSFSNQLGPFTVLEDHGDRIRIFDGHREGWTYKSDFVLLRDAVGYFSRRLDKNPKDTWALNSRGYAWYATGELDKAIKVYDEGIRLEPTESAFFANRGLAWHEKKQYDKAIHDDDEAIRLDPKDAVSFSNRGCAWDNKRQYDKAIRDYDKAIRLDPRCADAFNDLALLKARCPDSRYRDGRKAVELARKACELAAWNEPQYMDTLGAAYAEIGDFGAAIKWAKKALTFGDYKQENGERVQEWISRYERKQTSRTEQRILRRVIRYDVGDGELYRKELAGLGIVLAVPETDAKGNRRYRFYRDLNHLPAKGKIEDSGAWRRTFWEDTNPETVRLLARALRIPPPSEFIAFLPPRLEEEMLKMELAFKHVANEDLIKKTVFDVVAKPGGYKVIVRSQELRSKERSPHK